MTEIVGLVRPTVTSPAPSGDCKSRTPAQANAHGVESTAVGSSRYEKRRRIASTISRGRVIVGT